MVQREQESRVPLEEELVCKVVVVEALTSLALLEEEPVCREVVVVAKRLALVGVQECTEVGQREWWCCRS
jgi:hypothetical protein